MRSAAVTIVSGRHRHLVAQRASLRASGRPFDVHVVVAMGDPGVAALLERDRRADEPELHVVELPGNPARLPLAAARNAGAAAARASGAELLVFLDVDCVADLDLLERYDDAAHRRPDAVLCGPVTYLTERQSADLDDLRSQRAPHGARPDPAPGRLLDGDHTLFWSLSFALTARTWATIGGFDEVYEGYGAEDTDFGMRASAAGVPLVWVGGADAFHQYHPTHNPPSQHVDDILRNGALFAARWGWWPMSGWLEGLSELGLVRRRDGGWVRGRRLRIASVPEQHPYVGAVTPAVVDAAGTGRSVGWDPDPLFDEDTVRRLADDIDVVHLHFGFEHLSSGALARWLDLLRELHLPLVVTVHDLRNPHLVDNGRHESHLRLLMAAAAAVITLTTGAADVLRAEHGREALVVAHPTVVDEPTTPRGSSRVVLVPLGALRANVQDVDVLLEAAAVGADREAGRVVVDLRAGFEDDPRTRTVRAMAADGRVDLVVSPRRSDADLAQFVSAAWAVVLPYRFGTHSGWIELATDVGARPVVPSCGFHADQTTESESYVNDERRGLDAESLSDAVARALAGVRPPPAERAERVSARAHARAAHEVVYRQVIRR